MTRTITALLIAATLAGCATRGSNYVPLVDMKGQNEAQFRTDVADCQGHAEQRAGARSGAVAGALVGALLGAAIAPRGYRNSTAAAGIGTGAIAGGAGAAMTQENIIKQCLVGRGYSVLN